MTSNIASNKKNTRWRKVNGSSVCVRDDLGLTLALPLRKEQPPDLCDLLGTDTAERLQAFRAKGLSVTPKGRFLEEAPLSPR